MLRQASSIKIDDFAENSSRNILIFFRVKLGRWWIDTPVFGINKIFVKLGKCNEGIFVRKNVFQNDFNTLIQHIIYFCRFSHKKRHKKGKRKKVLEAKRNMSINQHIQYLTQYVFYLQQNRKLSENLFILSSKSITSFTLWLQYITIWNAEHVWEPK